LNVLLSFNLLKIIFIVLIGVLLISCEQEIARIDLSKNKNIAIDINCEKDRQIDFYLDCDIEYSQMPTMVMDFEFFKGAEQLLKGGLDPFVASPKTDEIKNTIGSKTHWKFYGKLEGNFIPTADTVFTIKPILIKNNHPDLVINKFELVLVR